MQHAPIPSAAETRANACFDALMWALSRPGLPRALPEAGAGQLIDALIDRECAVWAADDALAAHAARNGAAMVEVEKADHVFAGQITGVGLLPRLRCGSDLYPDDGATLVLDARFGDGPHLRFTGPGVDGAVTVALSGLPDGFWAARDRALRYPMGFDMFLLDGAEVIGVPRSTKVEVL